MERRKSIRNLNSARVLLVIFYSAAILTHVLVIAKLIPYSLVSGGMAASYNAQAVQSAVSIVVIGLFFLFTWKLSNPSRVPKNWQKRLLWLLTASWVVGFIMQVLGTSFERYVLSIVLLVGIVGHVWLLRTLPKS